VTGKKYCTDKGTGKREESSGAEHVFGDLRDMVSLIAQTFCDLSVEQMPARPPSRRKGAPTKQTIEERQEVKRGGPGKWRI